MHTNWNYAKLAKTYPKRADYSSDAINKMLKFINLKKGKICDIGSGTGKLTLQLLKRNFSLVAVEPNKEMRKLGIKFTKKFKKIKWENATAEKTELSNCEFDLVTFGSSFNVCNRTLALQEAHRILKNKSWFVCMWNHRVLKDKHQAAIEKIIKKKISNYKYGVRRESQTRIINLSKLFTVRKVITKRTKYNLYKKNFLEAWYSHATLQRQSKNKFNDIILDISNYLKKHVKGKKILVLYDTKIWIAQKNT
tara:strand:+ start:12 stop:764 length:753 start_codon:yes stop_codon:yes gene_type:complete